MDRDFLLDPIQAARAKTARARKVHAVQVPILRLAGLSAFALLVAIFDLSIGGSLQGGAGSLGFDWVMVLAIFYVAGRADGRSADGRECCRDRQPLPLRGALRPVELAETLALFQP